MTETEIKSKIAAETPRVRKAILANFLNIPEEFKAIKQWVVYRFDPRETEKGSGAFSSKLGKPPVSPSSGNPLSWTDPKNFLSFEQAVNALKANKPGNLAGIGLVFTGKEPFSGVDVDSCIDQAGKLTDRAREIVDRLDSYTEVSPSGTGLRIIGRGKLPEGDNGGKHGDYEAYSAARFLTMTGVVFDEKNAIREFSSDLAWFRKTYATKPEEKPSPRGHQETRQSSGPLSDDDILKIIGKAKNSAKIQDLMNGGGDSEGDAALIWELAFYTKDPAQIDRLMRTTKRDRKKWDEKRGKETFLIYEIKRGLAKYKGGSYEPKSKPAAGSLQGEPGKPDEWTTPICFLEKIALPKFPSEFLPDALRGYVEAVADCRQVPVDLPAFLAIAVAAAAGARKYRVYIGNSHAEPLNVWPVTALPPGSRKSDTFDDMIKPLYIEQSRLSAIMKPAIDEAKALQKIHEKRMEYVLSQAVKEKNREKREELEEEYSEMGQTGIKVPSFPCLVASGDTTPEAVAALLEEQGGRIAIMDTEGGLFSVIAGRYDGKGESNMDVWLKMHAGDELSIHRRNRPPIEVTKPAGTVAITVQPGVIKDLAAKKDFKDRGLLGRFLYAIPESLVGKRLYQNKRIDQAVKDSYLEAIRRIFLQPEANPENEHDRAPHHRLYLRGAALEVWEEFYNDLEKRQARGGDLEGITDWASKCAGALARIAGVFHIIETGGNPDQAEISVETMVRAYEIGRRHLIEHAKAAYGLMSMTADTHLARDILTWIAAKGKTVFTATDFWVDNRSKGNCLDDLLPAFELLADREIIRELPAINTVGRKPKRKYEVNPSCKACFRCLKDE